MCSSLGHAGTRRRDPYVDCARTPPTSRGVISSLILLLLVLASCIPIQPPSPTPIVVTRVIEDNDLPLRLGWTRRFQSAQMNATEGITCTDRYGAAILEDREPVNHWQGLIVFDAEGQVVWNHASEWRPGAVTIDEERLYLLVPPSFRAYALETGELLWTTEDALRYRIGPPHLYLKDHDLIELQSLSQLNVYQRSNGTLVSAQTFPYRDFAQRHDELDIHIHSRIEEALLYATPASDSKQLLWSTETPVAFRSHLLRYQNSVVGEFLVPDEGRQLCRLRISDGEKLWCSDENFWSNIAARGEVGYGVRTDGDLVAFRLADGVTVGGIDFEPGINTNRRYQVAVCDEHLLAYLSNPDELYWFDFIDEE